MKPLFALTLAVTASAQTLPEGPGKPVFEKMCTPCHGLENVVRVRMTKERWGSVVDDMISRGAAGTDDEIDQVIAYLTANFGPDAPRKVNVNKATAAELSSSLGISAAEADAIVHYRADHGDFKEFQEVARVPGIDAKKLEAARDRLGF